MRFSRTSIFWIGLLLIVVAAAVPRFLSYQFSLPYVDHPDEPTYYYIPLERRGLFDNNYERYAAAPPVHIAFGIAVQLLLEPLGIQGMSATVGVLRLISVITSLVTLILTALTARLVAGNVAGWLAGISWGIAPLMLENGVYALPDPLIYVLVALALWLAAVALVYPERGKWCIWSVIVGVIAILVKYPVLSAIAPGGLVALVIFFRDRKRGLRYLVIQATILGLTAAWLFWGYGLATANWRGEAMEAQTQGLSNALDIDRVLNNLYYTIYPINAAAFGIVCFVGASAYFFLRRRSTQPVHLGVLGLAVIILITIPWLASTYSIVADNYRLRDVLPAMGAACILFGTALSCLISLIPRRFFWIGTALVIAPVIFLVYAPQLRADIELVRGRSLPDRRVELRQWFDANHTPGTVIVDTSNHKTFNAIYGGIPYKNWVDWWVSDDIMEYPLDEWRDQRGMSYAVIPREQIAQMNASSAGQNYLAGMLHLRDFYTRRMRGPEMAIYRLTRMQIETQFTFGDTIQLVGYDYSGETVKPGDVLTLRFYWQALTMPVDNYSLFIHIVPEDEYDVLAQGDGAPASRDRPTLSWDDPGETLISPAFDIALPTDLSPGEYRVMVGLYNYIDGTRLPIKDENGAELGDTLELLRITVEP